MKKSNENKEKCMDKTSEKIWVDEHVTLKKRVCSSGVTFSGKYKSKT